MLTDRRSSADGPSPVALAARLLRARARRAWPRRAPPAHRPTGRPLAAQTDAAGGAAATVEQCVTTGEQTDRSATFSGEMTAIAGTARMAMRIEVQERLPGEELFHTVSAPGLGVWRGSAPGVKIYQYVKQVTNLLFAGHLPRARALPLAERQGLRDQARRTAHAPVCAAGVRAPHAAGHAGPSRHARRLDRRESASSLAAG